jgi:hypothetical protein
MGASSVSPSDDAGAETTRQLVGAAVGDRCVTCGAPLASDQRYCLNCGERRGKSRFPPASAGAQTTSAGAQAASAGAQATQPAGTPPTRAPRDAGRRRLSSGATLVAGIATLLLAMGVGVEIGRISHTSNASTQRASAPSVQVVTVGGSGGSVSAPASTSPSPRTKAKSKVKAASTNSNAKAPVTKQVAAKATQAASQVLGSSAKNLAPATVKTGQACHGAGCQGGKFTGNFFGQ